MKLRVVAVAAIVMLAYGCASTKPAAPRESETLRGVASWYGEEFAGRTTANGEIFDPSMLTAAHRTLPFGTILDVMNTNTRQSVRVRINDRGPYVGNRVIDLSYAAAQQIGLVEPGIGPVEIRIVKVGSGEREPPAPFDVTIAEAPVTNVPSAGDPPAVAFPLPGGASVNEEGVVERVDVEVERGGVAMRRQVSADGREIEEVPIEGGAPLPATRAPAPAPSPRASVPRVAPRAERFVVQVGAFSVEENATRLRDRLADLGHRAVVDHDEYYRVRIGPFATRDEAATVRTALERDGISAMILSE
jgi:rare lipoprotein A